MEDKYYTPKEVATLLKLSYMTIFRWIRSDKLSAVKVGKQYRIKEKDISNFINIQNEK